MFYLGFRNTQSFRTTHSDAQAHPSSNSNTYSTALFTRSTELTGLYSVVCGIPSLCTSLLRLSLVLMGTLYDTSTRWKLWSEARRGCDPTFSGCVTVTSTCCGAAVDALDGGGCMRRLRCQTNMAAASIATSRQPPSARPIARPGPASCAATGGGGGGNTGGLGGGSRRRREPQSLQSVPNSHIDPKAAQPPS